MNVSFAIRITKLIDLVNIILFDNLHIFTSVYIGVNANLVLVDKFSYLGDILSVDGDADAAVENRIQIRWNTFRQLAPLLTNKNISL